MAKAPTDIRSLARAHTETAVRVLVGIMQESSAPQAARVAAANSLLDRGWGKAIQHIEAETVHRYVARVPDKAATAETWHQQHSPPTLQ